MNESTNDSTSDSIVTKAMLTKAREKLTDDFNWHNNLRALLLSECETKAHTKDNPEEYLKEMREMYYQFDDEIEYLLYLNEHVMREMDSYEN